MKILVDENMPYARELFSRLGNVKAVPGRPIPVNELDDADALMVRSVTKVNASLLAGKAIKFVGTATAGTDHVDDKWLKQAGIGFSAAPGCNAIAVVEYVFSSLLMLAERDGFSLYDRTVGIVGVGNVGRRLQARLEALGIKTLLCDPPRADRGDEGDFRSLDELVQRADILTFHTPLFKDGPYKTLHLADVLFAPEQTSKYALVEGLVVYFLYFEFIALIVKYFQSGFHFPLRYFVYIGITAIVRLIIVDHKSPLDVLIYSAAILLLVITLWLCNSKRLKRE